MAWNYRLILHDTVPADLRWIGLHEVYYQDDGRVRMWTEKAVSFVCDPEEGAVGIVGSLEKALNDARTKPMLVESELDQLLAPSP